MVVNAAASAQSMVSIVGQGNQYPTATHDEPKQKAVGQTSNLRSNNQGQSYAKKRQCGRVLVLQVARY